MTINKLQLASQALSGVFNCIQEVNRTEQISYLCKRDIKLAENRRLEALYHHNMVLANIVRDIKVLEFHNTVYTQKIELAHRIIDLCDKNSTEVFKLASNNSDLAISFIPMLLDSIGSISAVCSQLTTPYNTLQLEG